ncbi:MAG: DUF6575 domain-containing protein [Candidatus Parabeggiatoa sp.]|nr:DUF6575 domain-containing protein [Candidatus Parabeggiatoa sp.]
METLKGFKLDKFTLKLEHIADLISFNGPLLSLFENDFGENYFYCWCDVDERYNRWLVFRVSYEQLRRYLMEQISLHDLTLNPVEGFVYCLDIDNALQYQNVYLLRPTNLPEMYIPSTDSYYDLESELEEEEKKAILSRVLTAANTAIYSLQKMM